jgi:Flp pilus assembly protein TadG
MASLARRLLRLSRSDERGAIGVLVAVLMAGGVLIGMGALVVDVGQLYQERAELQNGADAAAVGVAKSCALGNCAPGVATSYADANASKLTGGVAAVDLVCGSGNLGACPASTGVLTDCPPPPVGVNYVDVSTSTQTASGSTLLPPIFARTLLGNSGYQGSNVVSCAQAEWGAPASANVIAVTISACEWDQATSGGTVFAPPPPAQLPSPSLDQVLTTTNLSSGTGCPAEPAGADPAGTFGWTADSGNCALNISGASYAAGPADPACDQVLDDSEDNLTSVFLPIYVSVTGQGSAAIYTLKGFAAFVVTGYNLDGVSDPDRVSGQSVCAGCISGYFTQGVVPFSGSIGGTNLGVSVINLTG